MSNVFTQLSARRDLSFRPASSETGVATSGNNHGFTPVSGRVDQISVYPRRYSCNPQAAQVRIGSRAASVEICSSRWE